ncbi:glycosyltransferase family 4 protein [Schleiferiaceae bacterium]|nr:glycosyltransferase family 4 protein [Schleiferiaceae bacterium]
MAKILYLGNVLNGHGLNKTTIETLGKDLSLYYDIVLKSSKINQTLRLLDMLWAVLTSGKSIILIDTYSTKAFYFAFFSGMLCRITSKKYVIILHGGNLPKRFEAHPSKSFFLLSGAQAIVAPSPYLGNSVRDNFGLRASIIPNSIDIMGYRFLRREDYGVLKLLWVRAFDKIYNPLLALDIVSILIKKGYEARLCMIGPDKDGSMEEAREYCRTLNLDHVVEFTGQLPKDVWLEKSYDYNLFINTSKFDNMPVTLIEAMATGLPVVTTNVGGIPYFVENKKEVLFAQSGEAIEFVENIESILLSDSLRLKLVNNARSKAESFDTERVLKKWTRVLS